MKRTSLKHIEPLACSAGIDLDALFKWGLSEAKFWSYGLSDAINQYTEGWDYWYGDIERDAVKYYGDDLKAYLCEKYGHEVERILDEDDEDFYDPAICDAFSTDCARAYSDAMRDAEQSKFYELVVSDIEDAIEKVGAPYFCYLKLKHERKERADGTFYDSRSWVETDHLYEAERVLFGFTRQWHKDAVATANGGRWGAVHRYDPDELEGWADETIDEVRKSIDIEYRIQECADDEVLLDLFKNYNEVEDLLKSRAEAAAQAQADADAAAAYLQQHNQWVARATRRLGH